MISKIELCNVIKETNIAAYLLNEIPLFSKLLSFRLDYLKQQSLVLHQTDLQFALLGRSHNFMSSNFSCFCQSWFPVSKKIPFSSQNFILQQFTPMKCLKRMIIAVRYHPKNHKIQDLCCQNPFFILLISHTLSLFRKADARLGRRMSTVRHSIGVRTGLFSTLVQ